MANTKDQNLLEEQSHWDTIAEKMTMTINPDSYMASKGVEDLRKLYKKVITQLWPDHQKRNVCIGEIGSGSGSAMTYLNNIEFAGVRYFGSDVSMKYLLIGATREPPDRWTAQFLRASANRPIFCHNSLDIVFSAAALHHVEIETAIRLISYSIRPGGLFILNEPQQSLRKGRA